MSEPTAKERATDVIYAAMSPYAAIKRATTAAIDKLMANPDLLVDLAIEAGGLVSVKPTTVHIGFPQDRFTVTADPGTAQVFYRRGSPDGFATGGVIPRGSFLVGEGGIAVNKETER